MHGDGRLAGARHVVDRLVRAGVPEDEAGVFVYLSAAGPSKAGGVAHALGLTRSDAYRVLDRLVARDAVVKAGDRPARYEAVPPERFLDAIVAEVEARAASVRGLRDETVAALRALRGADAGEAPKNLFKVVRGRAAAFAAMERMVRDARGEVLAATTDPHAVRILEGAGLRALGDKRAGEGLRVRFLVRTNPALRAFLEPLLSGAGVEVRHFETDHALRFLVVDRREVLLWVSTDPSDRIHDAQDVAIWTDASDMVASHGVLFDTAWEAAADLATLPPSPQPPVGREAEAAARLLRR